MSEENVDIVRAGFEAWNAGDMAAYRELLDPAVTMHGPARWPEPGPFIGLDAVLRQFEQFRETWDTDVAEPKAEFTDAGDAVVTRIVWHSHGRGPDANMEISCVYRVANGKHLSFDFFWDHAEALKAAGLD